MLLEGLQRAIPLHPKLTLAMQSRIFDKSDVPHINFTNTMKRLMMALQDGYLLWEQRRWN
jgi:hypothetical protein